MRLLYYKLIGIRSDFEGLFFKNEYLTLSRQSSSGMLTLVVILLLTFLALGFSIGGLEYLDEKMNNPYTNWLDIQINSETREHVPEIEEFFDKQENLKIFDIKNYGKYRISFERLKHEAPLRYETHQFKYRTFEPNSDIVKRILEVESGNVVVKHFEEEDISEFLSNSCGIIITQEALERFLGCINYETQKLIRLDLDDKDIYLPILAVVKQLPNRCDFACTPRMLNMLDRPLHETNFIDNRLGTSNIVKFVADIDDIPGIESSLREEFPDMRINKLKNSAFDINSQEEHFLYEVIMLDYLEYRDRDSILMNIKAMDLNNGKIVSAYYETNCPNKFNYIESPTYMAFNFEELLNVRHFQDTMKSMFNIEVSMSQVEAKENFALVSRMTYFISIVLFGFSLASIVFYVDSLLKTHLQKVKTNLGTLKAFGLTNKFLVNSYIKIVFTFLVLSIIFAYVISVLFDIGESILRSETYFNLMNWQLYVAIGLIILFSLYKSLRTISKILSDTPGNLIYNR